VTATVAPPALGPAALDIVERCRRLEGGGLRTFVEDPPTVWNRASGCWVEDPDGTRWLDLYGGYAVAATGHAHPRVVEAIRGQAEELIHCPSAHPSRVRAEFLEALASIAPPGLDRILPAVTGAMANELALAIARTVHPGEVITFDGSYFGRAAGVVGLAGKPRFREALGLPEAGRRVPFPYPLRMGPGATDAAMESLDAVARETAVSAVIVEPVQGNGGVVIPPDDFLPRLRAFCDRTGCLLILDEIQSGCGRTGRMWAADHAGVIPDLMTVGKGVGGGMGVAAVLGRPDLLRWPPDAYSSTFLTNSVTLAAAAAAIAVLRDEDLPGRAARLGPAMLDGLRAGLVGIEPVAEVRGIGLWAGIELVDAQGRPDPGLAAAVVRKARGEGVLLGRGGDQEHVVKVSPPLIIEGDDLSTGVAAVARAIRATTAGGSS
jgi:4-aminobutyrate aminotransferase-like enzyme